MPVTAGIASRMWDDELLGGVSSGRVVYGTGSVEGDGDPGSRQLPRADEELHLRTRLALVDRARVADRAGVVAERRSKTACIPQAVDQFGERCPTTDGDAHVAQACQRPGRAALPGRPI